MANNFILLFYKVTDLKVSSFLISDNTFFPFIIFSRQEFFEYLEKARALELDNLARKYRAIGPLLTKMEGLVVHTNTGRSPKLQPYYAYWENAVYEALTKVRQLSIWHH